MKVVHGRLGYMIPYLRRRLITSNWPRPFSNLNHYNPLIAQPFSGEVLTVPGLELRLFAAKAPPPLNSYYLRRESDIATVGTTFNVFSYYAVCTEHRTNHLTDAAPSGCNTCYATDAGFKVRHTLLSIKTALLKLIITN